ncbi:hypothetical protein C0995_014451 [Termitomyces sp. Mi166|nr:hypothetical protein C0995_014451 [Termitomyces sp. Mi166\
MAFYTQSMIAAELNYNIYNKELLAIVKAFKQWQAYLEDMWHCIQYFTMTKQPQLVPGMMV